MKVILVRWVDARHHNEMMFPEEARECLPCKVFSVGFEVKRDGDVVIAEEYFPRDKVTEKEETWRFLTVIPGCCVEEIVELGDVGEVKKEVTK